MLQMFRNFFKSKIGIVVTLGFLALIALAFASMDVANTGTFGGVTGGDRVAVVGDQRVDSAEFITNANSAVQRERAQDPTVTMQNFVARGGLDQVLDSMLTRTALAVFGKQIGLRAGDRLVDSEIVGIPAFAGTDGKFDQTVFTAALRQQGLSEATVRQDIAMSLYANQLLTPVSLGAVMPTKIAQRYVRLRREQRQGVIGVVPALLFAPKEAPADDVLNAYYTEHREEYVRPERRVIRFATFGEAALGTLAAPTDAQIAARFDRDKPQYAAREDRSFTQLVVPTKAAAQAILDKVNAGSSLAAAASSVGLETSKVGPVDRKQFATDTSAAVASAGFSAARGAMSAPVQGALGWYVLKVDAVDQKPAKSLAQVRGEISAQLAAEQKQQALNELTGRVDDELSAGKSLGDIAKELKLEVKTTEPLTAAGQVYGTPQQAPQELARVLQVAFEMEEDKPAIDAVVPGQLFLIYDVARITRSAAAPLTEIRADVVDSWRRDTGLKLAGEAASRILKRVQDGATIAKAFADEKVSLPAPRPLTMGRQELEQMQQVPGVLALFFSMAEGTTKRLEEPREALWYVTRVDDISAPELAKDDPLIASSIPQLGALLGDEYTDQFVKAIEATVGVERNQAAIDAVRSQLTGDGN